MLTIRPAKKRDAKILIELQHSAFRPIYQRFRDSGNPYLHGVEDILTRLERPACKYYCICDDDVVIGGMLVRSEGSGLFFDRLGEGEYYLQRIYIKPERQNERLARQAILLWEKELSDIKRILVDFPEELEPNRRCYESVGFHDTGRRKEVEPGFVLACFEKVFE